MELGYVGAALAAFVALVVYGFRPSQLVAMRKVPGPLPSFLIGNMGSLQSMGWHKFTSTMAARYGPVFRMFTPLGPLVTLTDARAIKAVAAHELNRGSPPPNMSNVAADIELEDGNVALKPADAGWRALRAVWVAFLSNKSLDAYWELTNEAAAKLAAHYEAAAKGDTSVDAQKLSLEYVLSVIGSSAYGVDLAAKSGDALQMRKDLMLLAREFGGSQSKWVVPAVMFPELGWLVRLVANTFPDQNLKDVKAARARLRAVTLDLIVKAKAEAKEAASNPDGQALLKGSRRVAAAGTFLDTLVAARDRETGQPLSDMDITAQAYIMVLGGVETTSNTLAILIHWLAANPSKAARVAAEIDAQAGPLTRGSLEDLTYLNACLLESMRLVPPLSGFVRETTKAYTFSGVTIDKGTRIYSSAYCAQRDASIFPEPDAFVPERWLNGSAGANLEAWVPFGMGGRGCPAQRFAFQSVKLAVVHLLRSCELRLAPGQNELELTKDMLLAPAKGVHVSVHKR